MHSIEFYIPLNTLESGDQEISKAMVTSDGEYFKIMYIKQSFKYILIILTRILNRAVERLIFLTTLIARLIILIAH